MAPTVGSERADMARIGPGGLALLPWTRQMLTVLWTQIRLLLQVIYYTFISVFQMFRFEVHVRITDETGQRIQHMSAAANPPDSFLFSTLFEGDGGVMVGGSGHISNFCSEMGDPFAGKSGAEALLSSLRAEELCCGLVDGFVSRTSAKEDGVFGSPGSWELGFSSDWGVFGSCSEEEEEEEEGAAGAGSSWSSEEDQNPFEFDSEESQNLWESLSGSSDPYNPLYFSACTSTRTRQGASEPDRGRGGTGQEVLDPGANQLVSRSDSEISWGSSDGSTLGEEAEQLLQLFATSDPYDPMCFTACPSTAAGPGPDPGPAPPPPEDQEEQLWESLSAARDPYHSLDFQARLRSASAEPQNPTRTGPRASRPSLQERPSNHRHPETTTVPWTPPRKAGGTEQRRRQPGPAHKKVRFSPVVRVHVMRSWTFARQASRRGNWEEMARDRDRFQRRVREAEAQLGPCLSPAHRRKVRAHLDGALTRPSLH